MSNLHDQLRRYGGYLDTLEAPATAPDASPTRTPRRFGTGFGAGFWTSFRMRLGGFREQTRRPRVALALTCAIVLVAALGITVAVTGDDGSGNLTATRAAQSPAATKAAGDGVVPGAAVPDERSSSSTAIPGAAGTAPNLEIQSAVERQLRAALGTCPTVGQAKARVRRITTVRFGTAYAIRVDPSSGPCLRLASIDWEPRTVHLERFRSTP